jgi:hypothetical protein
MSAVNFRTGSKTERTYNLRIDDRNFMDIVGTLILITTLILVVAFILRPLIASADSEDVPVKWQKASALRERADLLAGRNRVYAALRDLDFDYKTNKLSDAEYGSQRRALVAQGVEILQRLDALPEADESPDSDPVEAMVVAFRSGGMVNEKDRDAGGSRCPKCRKKTRQGDSFCAGCGAKISTGKRGKS